MDPRRWHEIRRAFEAIVALDDVHRADRLAEIGATDPALRSAVEELLEADAKADTWLAAVESPVRRGVETIGHSDAEHVRAKVQEGLALSYRIERELGGGGMSCVFAAEELAFHRKVVVKVVRPQLAEALSVKRFEREILLAARLQHPHIVPLLHAGEADGLPYYTMPFVEGETLRERLRRRGELPIDETVRILRDVASALAYAHEHGVVHRDIKPENVMMSDGGAMVTDFGIAKAATDSLTPEGGAQRSTLTEWGTVIGTPLYMAPEQASADPATDERADIYSLGVVAFEMLTGRPPFDGRSSQQLLAAHAVEVPEDVARRRPGTPDWLAAIVMRCLEKRPADRPQSAREIITALHATDVGGRGRRMGRHGGSALTLNRIVPGGWTSIALGVSVAAAAVVVLLVRQRPESANNGLVRFDLTVLDSVAPEVFQGSPVAISPNGSALAYVGSRSGAVYVRALSETQPRRIPQSEGADCPMFSPDGRWLLFVAGGRVKKSPVRGGEPVVLSDSAGLCAVWTDRGEVIFDVNNSAIYRMSANGGAASLVVRADSSKRLGLMIPTQPLPEGRGVLLGFSETRTINWQVAHLSLEDGRITPLTLRREGLRLGAQYSKGHILSLGWNGTLVAQPFSLRELRFTGPPTTIVPDSVRAFVAASNGTLAYYSFTRPRWELVAVALDGTVRHLGGHLQSAPVEGLPVSPLDTAFYAWPRISPDGRRVALEVRIGPLKWDVWIFDIATRTLARLTRNFTGARPFAWSADARHLTYLGVDSADIDGPLRIVSQPWDGSAPPRDVMRVPFPMLDATFSSRGDYAVIAEYGRNTIWLAPLDTPRAIRPLIATSAEEVEPRLSNDGHLLAYTSNETGRFEVYAFSMVGPAARVQVSQGGGVQPVWSADGKYLFYRGPRHMMRANVQRRPALGVVRRDTLFEDRFTRYDATTYDVFPDGTELVMIRGTAPPVRIGMILNWQELLSDRLHQAQ